MQHILQMFRLTIRKIQLPELFTSRMIMKYSFIFSLLTLFGYFFGYGQMSLSVSHTNATCSANGTITVQVNNGTAPFSYFLNGMLQMISPNNNQTFVGLQSNNYQIHVTDNTGQSVSQNEPISSTYLEPTLYFAVVNCNIQAIVSNGLAPFSFAMANNDSVFTNFQSSSLFTNLVQDSSSFIRVIDSCGNFATTAVASTTLVPKATPTCFQATDTTFKVYLGNIVGGQGPYTVVCLDTNGVHTAVNDTFFSLQGCVYTIQITDACNRVFAYCYPSCIKIELPLACIDCDRGNLSFGVVGGMPPAVSHIYADMVQFNSNNTNISNLPTPQNGFYHVNYQDGCANKMASAFYYCFNTEITCTTDPFDGRVTFDLSANYKNYNPSYPITVICLDCANHDTVIINSNNDLPLNFDGMMAGTQHFHITDACGTVFLRNSECSLIVNLDMSNDAIGTGGGIPSTGGNCTGIAYCGNDLNITQPLPNCSYSLYTLTPVTQLYANNNTGIFPNLPTDKYLVEILSPTGFLLARDTLNTYFYFQELRVGCNKFTIGVCPGPAFFTLIDGDGNMIVSNDTTGIFENLIPGDNYLLTATQLYAPFKTISKNINIPTIGKLTYDIIGCSELFCHLAYQSSYYSPEMPTFTLQSDTGAYFVQNQTGYFNNFPLGAYTLTVTRGVCDTIVKQINIGTKLAVSPCLSIHLYDDNYTIWRIDMALLIAGIDDGYTLYDATTGQTYPLIKDNTELFPGDYTLFSRNCEAYSFTIPPFPKHYVQAQFTSQCTNLACIKASGAWSEAKWENWAQSKGFASCGNFDTYILVFGSQKDTNSTGIFCNLKVGGNYVLYLLSNYQIIDTLHLTVPYYIQPDLSASFGALCDGDNAGEIMLMAIGSGSPFTYQLLNPPANYTPTSITSANDTAIFQNLPAGNYQFSLHDDCGYSADFASSINGTIFSPQWQYFCNGDLWLKAPLFTDATYLWKDAAGNEIGDAHEMIVPNASADTYQVWVTFPLCNSTGLVNVPPFAGSTLFADAGSNQYYPFYAPSANAFLQGNAAPFGVVAQWKQISPSTSNAVIANISQENTGITVSNAGIYTFVWYWETAACISTDTVTIIFSNCEAMTSPFSLATNASAESCKDHTNNGSASVIISGGLGPFTIAWSTGASTPTISQVSQGTYTVTVTDISGCSQNQSGVLQTIVIPFTSQQPKAYFESTPSDAEEVVENTPVYFQNFSENATLYEWTSNNLYFSNQENPTYYFPTHDNYTVKLRVFDDNCEDTYVRHYKVVPPGTLYIANAFTPHNGDEHNSTFIPTGTGIVEMQFWIYSRWGILIFESNSPDKPWDGTFQGEKCPEGVYTYRVKALLANGSKVDRAGTVTLIR